MIPHNFGYMTVIVSQLFFIVGLVWYVMQILDRERRDRYHNNSIKLLSHASATCDLAALTTRMAQLADQQPVPIPHFGRARTR